MFDRLQELVNRYEELGFRLNEPQVAKDDERTRRADALGGNLSAL